MCMHAWRDRRSIEVVIECSLRTDKDVVTARSISMVEDLKQKVAEGVETKVVDIGGG